MGKRPGRQRRIRTFYPAQIKQLRYLASIAWQEATNGDRRYAITCQCYPCNVQETRDGAVAAAEFLVSHNRHRTFIQGELAEGVIEKP